MMPLPTYLLTTVLSRYRHYILHLVFFYTLPHHLLLFTSSSSPLVLYLLYRVYSYSFFPLPSSPSTLSLTLALFSTTSSSSPLTHHPIFSTFSTSLFSLALIPRRATAVTVCPPGNMYEGATNGEEETCHIGGMESGAGSSPGSGEYHD